MKLSFCFQTTLRCLLLLHMQLKYRTWLQGPFRQHDMLLQSLLRNNYLQFLASLESVDSCLSDFGPFQAHFPLFSLTNESYVLRRIKRKPRTNALLPLLVPFCLVLLDRCDMRSPFPQHLQQFLLQHIAYRN